MAPWPPPPPSPPPSLLSPPRLLTSAYLVRSHTRRYGYGPLAPGESPAEVKMFRHPLLHSFALSIFCKLPIQPMTKLQHLRDSFITRILLSVFQFRVHGRWEGGRGMMGGREEQSCSVRATPT